LIDIDKLEAITYDRCEYETQFKDQHNFGSYIQITNSSATNFDSIGKFQIREHRDPYVFLGSISEGKYEFGKDYSYRIATGLVLMVLSIIPCIIAIFTIILIIFICMIRNVQNGKDLLNINEFIKEYNLRSYILTSTTHHHKDNTEEIKINTELDEFLNNDIVEENNDEDDGDYDKGLVATENDKVNSFRFDEFVLNDEKNNKR
jgi:uncharacterized membrane protein